tara:strand:- start:1927 stop:2721 length:795 start_codon:yes stop_codon:yes gene_type:complete
MPIGVGFNTSLAGQPDQRLWEYTFDGVDMYAAMGAGWSSLGDGTVYTTITYTTDNEDGYVLATAEPISEFGRVGTDYHSGTLSGLLFADAAPMQNRTSVVGNQARYCSLTTAITLPTTSDWIIELEWLRYNKDPSGVAQTGLLGQVDLSSTFYVYDTAQASNPNRAALLTSGNDIYFLGGAHFGNVPEGNSCKVKLIKTGTSFALYVDDDLKETKVQAGTGDFIIEQLGASSSTRPLGIDAQLGNVRITDSTLSKEWYYTLENV